MAYLTFSLRDGSGIVKNLTKKYPFPNFLLTFAVHLWGVLPLRMCFNHQAPAFISGGHFLCPAMNRPRAGGLPVSPFLSTSRLRLKSNHYLRSEAGNILFQPDFAVGGGKLSLIRNEKFHKILRLAKKYSKILCIVCKNIYICNWKCLSCLLRCPCRCVSIAFPRCSLTSTIFPLSRRGRSFPPDVHSYFPSSTTRKSFRRFHFFIYHKNNN